MSTDAPDAAAPLPCSACRGTGRVVSMLGGERHEVACPWCEGSGDRLPDHDAQAAKRAEAEAEAASAPPSGGDAA